MEEEEYEGDDAMPSDSMGACVSIMEDPHKGE